MKNRNTTIVKQNQDIYNALFTAGAVLMIPFFGMLFGGWDWGIFDFAVIGTLLISAGLTYVFAARKLKNHRFILGVIVVLAVLLLWAEMGVGLFGSPIAGN